MEQSETEREERISAARAKARDSHTALENFLAFADMVRAAKATDPAKAEDMVGMLRNVIRYLGEGGVNDLLTELDHPLEPHWRALDTETRCALRTAWREWLRTNVFQGLEDATRIARAEQEH